MSACRGRRTRAVFVNGAARSCRSVPDPSQRQTERPGARRSKTTHRARARLLPRGDCGRSRQRRPQFLDHFKHEGVASLWSSQRQDATRLSTLSWTHTYAHRIALIDDEAFGVAMFVSSSFLHSRAGGRRSVHMHRYAASHFGQMCAGANRAELSNGDPCFVDRFAVCETIWSPPQKLAVSPPSGLRRVGRLIRAEWAKFQGQSRRPDADLADLWRTHAQDRVVNGISQ